MLSYIIAAFLAGATPAAASGGDFSLEPGQAKTFTVTSSRATPTAESALKPDGAKFKGDAVKFAFASPGDEALTLSVQNGYGRRLVYNANIYLASGQHGHTSTCPVMPHIFGVEIWSDPIVRIEISDVRLTDDDEDLTCH